MLLSSLDMMNPDVFPITIMCMNSKCVNVNGVDVNNQLINGQEFDVCNQMLQQTHKNASDIQ